MKCLIWSHLMQSFHKPHKNQPFYIADQAFLYHRRISENDPIQALGFSLFYQVPTLLCSLGADCFFR